MALHFIFVVLNHQDKMLLIGVECRIRRLSPMPDIFRTSQGHIHVPTIRDDLHRERLRDVPSLITSNFFD
jgi:hypothetical protein